jgi:hypothetical protein
MTEFADMVKADPAVETPSSSPADGNNTPAHVHPAPPLGSKISADQVIARLRGWPTCPARPVPPRPCRTSGSADA